MGQKLMRLGTELAGAESKVNPIFAANRLKRKLLGTAATLFKKPKNRGTEDLYDEDYDRNAIKSPKTEGSAKEFDLDEEALTRNKPKKGVGI
jgi:hypothetical protein